jgi:arylsulfatase A-like enzyme
MNRSDRRTARRRRIVVLVVATLVVAGILIAVYPRPVSRPSVILISIDSLRPDRLGCYGHDRATSPFLDRFASEGALFETAVSSTSWTLPAHAALFTGLADRVHGCLMDGRWLDGSRVTLAEAFREAGYRTVGFFSGPYLHPAFGFAQGFDGYHDCTSYSRETIARLRGRDVDLDALSHHDVTNPTVLREVTKWLEADPQRPVFLFIHLWDVHYDYIPPEPYRTMFDPGYEGPVDGRNVEKILVRPEGWTRRDCDHLRALYDGEIRWTDDTLAALFTVFEQSGLLRDCVTAITSDHGEAFFEHGTQGHRHTLFEEEVRIPLLVRGPGRVPAGIRVAQPVAITDIGPTLLELAGVAPFPVAGGTSLVPLLEDPTLRWPEKADVSELLVGDDHVLAIRTPRWKYLFAMNVRRMMVFDLLNDPGERQRLPEDRYPMSVPAINDLLAGTLRELHAAAQRLPAIGRRDTPPIQEMTEAQLRSLGYLK